jgi:hypothetical protein
MNMSKFSYSRHMTNLTVVYIWVTSPPVKEIAKFERIRAELNVIWKQFRFRRKNCGATLAHPVQSPAVAGGGGESAKRLFNRRRIL